MIRFCSLVCVLTWFVGCGGDDRPEPLFQPEPECEGESVVPLHGHNQMVISYLEIGKQTDGFDLDGDGDPDNKLYSVGTLAASAIEDAFADFSLVIPMEFFDFQTPAADDCVKFGVYLGVYAMDSDGDNSTTASTGSDCNDHDPDIYKGAPEIPNNYKDDNCDGRADEVLTLVNADGGDLEVWIASDNEDDMDDDGVTIKDGDCDDTSDKVKPGLEEVCADGLDNDCDGNADYQLDGQGNPLCTPFDDSATPDTLELDPLSFVDGDIAKGSSISFTSGHAEEQSGVVHLTAGPSLFAVVIPLTDEIDLELRITGTIIEGDLTMMAAGWGLTNGRLGGIIDAATADKVTGLDIAEINLTPENTLLDAIFTNILGTLLGLTKMEEGYFAGCMYPDIDTDKDGLEAFCDSDLRDDLQSVDVCIDGDGTVYCEASVTLPDALKECDEIVTGSCTEATHSDGTLKFLDGISVELNFEMVPVHLPTP